MVDHVRQKITNPIIISALACAVLFYTGSTRIRPWRPVRTLIPLENVTGLTGRIVSNPVRGYSGSYYRTQIQLESVTGDYGGPGNAVSSAGGVVTVSIDSAVVESLYPGKLYSSSGARALIESGERVRCAGRFNPVTGTFIAYATEHIGPGDGLAGRVMRLRALARLQFKRLMFAWGEAGALVLALLAGSREYTPGKVGDLFRDAGLSHVLALSGMHLSFFSRAAGMTGTRIFGRKHSQTVQLIGILTFVWFAGLSPSLFRALLCTLLMMLGARLFVSGPDFLSVLAASFLIHSCVFPHHIKTAAFMLSYGALAGILIISPLVTGITSFLFPPGTASSLSASFGAFISTAPISLSLFGIMTPVSIISSVLVTPLISLFLALSLVSIILCLLMPFLLPVFGAILDALYRAIIFAAGIFARAPRITF